MKAKPHGAELIGLPMDGEEEIPLGVRAMMTAHTQFRGG